jgi:hypothetical protein
MEHTTKKTDTNTDTSTADIGPDITAADLVNGNALLATLLCMFTATWSKAVRCTLPGKASKRSYVCIPQENGRVNMTEFWVGKDSGVFVFSKTSTTHNAADCLNVQTLPYTPRPNERPPVNYSTATGRTARTEGDTAALLAFVNS